MRALLIMEWYQFRQGFLHSLLVAGASVIGMLYFDAGYLIPIVLVPNIASAIGMGTFMEEYQKGKMRFLYTLPVSRPLLWFVKMGAGIIGVIFFMAYIFTIERFYPSSGTDFTRQLMLANLDLDETGFLLLAFSVACYTFFVGAVVVSMCALPRNINLMNQLLIYMPIFILWFASREYSLAIRGGQVAAMLGIACLPLAGGSFALVRFRNPYCDPGRRLLFIGISTIAAALVCFASLLATTEYWSEKIPPQYGKNISFFVPSPDGSLILVGAMTKQARSQTYILDHGGKLVRDLGMDLMPMTWGDFSPSGGGVTWKPSATDSIILCQSTSEKMPEDGAMPVVPPLKLVNINTGEMRDLASLMSADPMVQVMYTAWLAGTDDLLALETRSNAEGASYTVIRQNTLTGELKRTELVRNEQGSSVQVLSNGLAVVRRENSKRVITVVDLRTGDRRDLDLRAEVPTISWAPDGEHFACVRHLISDTMFHVEILLGDATMGETAVLLDSDVLPSGLLSDAVNGKLGAVNAQFTERRDVILVSLWRNQYLSDHFFMNTSTRETFPVTFPKGSEHGGNLKFSPSGEYFLLMNNGAFREEGLSGIGKSRLEIFRIGPGRAEKVGEHDLAGSVASITWLDSGQILYGIMKNDTATLSYGATLRCINLSNKTDRLFFTGDSPNPPPEMIGLEIPVDIDRVPAVAGQVSIPMLWTIEGKSTSYIFGTIQIPVGATATLHPDVVKILGDADLIHTEIPMDDKTKKEIGVRLTLPEGRHFSDLIPQELYDQTAAYIRRHGFDPEPFGPYKVLFLAELLPQIEYIVQAAKQVTMDERIYRDAVAAGRYGGPVDSVSDQLEIYDGLSRADQSEFLRLNLGDQIEDESRKTNRANEAINFYLTGDIEAFRNKVVETSNPDHPVIHKYMEYQKKGNSRIAASMAAIVKSDSVKSHFFAITAVRLPGEEGIISQLERMGLSIKRSTAGVL